MNSPNKNLGVVSHSLLQGIFLTQGSNKSLLHYRWVLYHLSHQGSSGDSRLFFSYSGRMSPSYTQEGPRVVLHIHRKAPRYLLREAAVVGGRTKKCFWATGKEQLNRYSCNFTCFRFQAFVYINFETWNVDKVLPSIIECPNSKGLISKSLAP